MHCDSFFLLNFCHRCELLRSLELGHPSIQLCETQCCSIVHISVYCNVSSFGSSSMLTPGVWAEVNMGNQHLRLVSQQSARAVHGSRITPMLVGCAVET